VTTIYLLRHGALADDNQARFIGQIDLPLAAEGIRQAQALADALRHKEIGIVFCSDLLRTRQTAEIIAGETGIPMKTARDLREISLGHWEGMSRSDVRSTFPAQYAARGRDLACYRVPGGESYADCRLRLLSAWEHILSCGNDQIVVVSHAGINRLLLCHLLSIPMSHMFRIGQDYGCVNIVQQAGDSMCVQLVNGHPIDICGEAL
jgi:probable phosphoglycerate mutase